MTYRDPAPVQCETCLNKKTESPKVPMSKRAFFLLSCLSMVFVVSVLLAIDIGGGVAINHRFGDGWTLAWCAPTSVLSIGVFISAMFYLSELENK